MAKKNKQHVFTFKNILETEINQKNWNEKKQQLQEQFGKFKVALETDLAEAEAQKILDMFNEKLNLQLNVEQFKKDAEGVKKIIENALASLNNIDTSALKKIEDTLDNIADTTGKIFNQMEENANKAFNNIGQGAQKAAKKTIASVSKIDAELAKLGGNFTEVQNVLDFEITGSADKQLKALRLEQEKLNQAMSGDNWIEQQKALVRFMKAYESYQVKVKHNEKKIPKELSDLYHANAGKAGDAEINLRHIIDRHDKKWSGETSSGSVNVDTSKLATEETLKKIFGKLDKLNVNDGSDNKPPKNSELSPKNSSVPKTKEYISLRAIEKSDEFSKSTALEGYGAEYWSTGNDFEDVKKVVMSYAEDFEEIGSIIKSKIKPVKPLIFNANEHIWSEFDKISGVVEMFPEIADMMQVDNFDPADIQAHINKKAKEMGYDSVIMENVYDGKNAENNDGLSTTIAVLDDHIVELIGAFNGKVVNLDGKNQFIVDNKMDRIPDYYEGPQTSAEAPVPQSTAKNGATVSIDEATLGNAIASALQGVQLNANTQGEVKASIDIAELTGVLHDGTPYDVKDVGDHGGEKPATETTLGEIKGVLEGITNRLPEENANQDIVSRLDQIVTNTNDLPTSIKEALYAGEMANMGYSEITDADFDNFFSLYRKDIDEWMDNTTGVVFRGRDAAQKEFDNEYKGKFAPRYKEYLNVYDVNDKDAVLDQAAQVGKQSIVNRLEQISTNIGKAASDISSNMQQELATASQTIVEIVSQQGDAIVEAIKILLPENSFSSEMSGEAIGTLPEAPEIDENEAKRAFDTITTEIYKSRETSRDFFAQIQKGTRAVSDELKSALQVLKIFDDNGRFIAKIATDGARNRGVEIADNVVMKHDGDDIDEAMIRAERQKAAADAGANIAKVIEAKVLGWSKFELQTRLRGENLSTSKDFVGATNDQIDKLIADLHILAQNGLYPEFTGNNVLFDKEKGFSLLDLETSPWHGDGSVRSSIEGLIQNLAKGGFAKQGLGAPQNEINGLIDRIKERFKIFKPDNLQTQIPAQDQTNKTSTGLASEQTLSSIKTILESMSKEPEQAQQFKIAPDSIKAVLDGIKVLTPKTDTKAPWATEATLANGTNKKLEEVKKALQGMVMMPEPKTSAGLQGTSIPNSGAIPVSGAVGKVKVRALDEEGTVIFQKEETTTTKTANAIKTQKNVFKVDENGDETFMFAEIIEDFDKLTKEQETEEKKIKTAKAKLNEFITQFKNKTQGQAENISGFGDVVDLLDPEKTTWNLDTIETAKQKMLALNAEFNTLTQNFRKGSSSLNPFVNAINNSDKLRSQIKNIELDFTSLKDAPDELTTTVAGLSSEFNNAQQLLKAGKIKEYSEAYGLLREKMVKVVNEIRVLRKEQGVQQKSMLFDEDKEVAITRSDTQVAEWEKMSYIPDELRTEFRALHSELNNVIDKDELSIWKKQWEQIKIQITALRREHDGMEKDLKEVYEIYKQIGVLDAKIEGSHSDEERAIYQQEIAALQQKAEELAEEYRLNLQLAEIEKVRADAKRSSMVKVDASQARKSLNAEIKEARKQARVNAANTKWNAGKNALESLWIMDDVDLNKIPQVDLLQKKLDELSKTQRLVNEEIQKFGKSNHIEQLKKQTQGVAQLTAGVKDLVNNYERLSGDNTKQIGQFVGGGDDWEEQITAAIQSQFKGAKIKDINYDTKEVTYEVKEGTRAFTQYTAAIRSADDQIRAVKGSTKKLPSFLDGVKKKLGEISQYFSAMSLISRATQELRKGIQYIREIDNALTELKKVTDETEETYDKFLDTAAKTAEKVGSTIQQVVSSTADWARLGSVLAKLIPGPLYSNI